MKMKVMFSPEDVAAITKWVQHDPCEDIECSCFEGCENCPLIEAVRLRDKAVKAFEQVLKQAEVVDTPVPSLNATPTPSPSAEATRAVMTEQGVHSLLQQMGILP